MEEIEHGNKRSKLAFLFSHFYIGGWRKWTKQTRISQSKRWVLFRLAFLIEQIRKKNHIENVPNPPTPSFVEPCIVSDPNLPGASIP